MSNKLLKKHYNGHCLYRVIPDPVYLSLQTDGHGIISADALSGYSGNVVHLTATPDAGYAFSNYECTGATIVGNDLTFGREDCTAKANFDPNTYTLTLQTDGHGTLTANKITGHVGDTVTLTPTYNTYYRFNNYQNTGGSISNNTFTFGAQNATAKANFKTNNFTAIGTAYKSNYFTLTGFTGNKPASWPSVNGIWSGYDNVSGYNAYLKCTASCHFAAYTGGVPYGVQYVEVDGNTVIHARASNSTETAEGYTTNTGILSGYYYRWVQTAKSLRNFGTGYFSATGYAP